MTKVAPTPTTIEELKDFIIWAKSQRLKSVTIGQTSFEFSELAHVESLPDMSLDLTPRPDVATPASSPKLPDGNAQTSEDDELLYWSTKG